MTFIRHRFPVFALLILLLILTVPAAWAADDEEEEKPPLNSGALKGLAMRGIGPAFMSGRIADIAVHPTDPGTWYVAVGSGGIWKTVNSGTTWMPIFEDQGSYSVGCVTIDPHDPATIWVGSGENVSGRHVGYGDGVYRSRDGGQTWENLGLTESEHIGRIVVHPGDPNTVYVAAQGPLWSSGGERGVYMTTDSGATWEKVLGAGEYTGANEVLMDPSNPDVLYASLHQRFRDVAALMNGGPESGIHKSTDGGLTWRRLKAGLPKGSVGKIGLAISPQRPEVVYAAIEVGDRKGGFWRSVNGGESWEKRSDKISRGTGPHYYQEIFASPHAFDRVYFMDVQMAVTHDGGTTFAQVGEKDKHVDNHALIFSPTDPDYLLAGCDGGLYESWDLGKHWKFVSNLPVTQFYKVAVDYDEPFYHVIGGTQDNNTQYAPVRTDNRHGLRNADWRVTLFGDGHQPAMDPTNPDIFYSSLQQCNHYRVDRPTGEMVAIKPRPGADEPHDRWNWDGPILISRFDPARLYVASQRLWRSEDRGDSWTPLSGDLTRGEDRLLRPMMDRVQSIDAAWDLTAMSEYGTITSIAESPLDENLLYVGTDDGLIHVTEDGGATWRECKRPKGVAEHIYVNDLKADRFDRATVYAVLDGHKQGDFAPWVFRSTDAGKSWESIVGDLPERHLVWRIVQDTEKSDLLFLGTEFGAFVTVDGGQKWLKLPGAPNIPFRDLVIQERENDLVGATFGRGMYVLDDYSALRQISDEAFEQPALLFPTRAAWWYLPQRVLGWGEKGSSGSALFTAPNPPFGAMFTYYLKEPLMSREKTRQKEEKELAKEGADTPYPGWDALREERREDPPAVLMTVRDEAGEVVRTVTGPTAKGVHRVAWDLRYPNFNAEKDGKPDKEATGVLAMPGTYTVELAQRVDGVVAPLADPVSFEVVRLRERGLPGMNDADLAVFLGEMSDLQRESSALGASLDETTARVEAILVALARADGGRPELHTDAVALKKNLADMNERLRGDPRRRRMKAGGPISVNARLGFGQGSARGSTYGPTKMHQEQLEIGRQGLAELQSELEAVRTTDLPALEAQLDEAGVPWTTGRG